MDVSHEEGKFSIFINPSDPMAERHRRLDHLIKQHRESSKYENEVLDYDMIPLSEQPGKQAKIPETNIQIPPPVALKNQDQEKILKLSAEHFATTTKKYPRYFSFLVTLIIPMAIIVMLWL
jgi:hypothetical protein